MKILFKGITVLHVMLFVFFTFIWLTFADTYKVPKFMFSYFFPYEFSLRGIGVGIFPIILFQMTVIWSYIAALKSNKENRIIMNLLAGTIAICWFIFSNLSIFAAHIH